MSPAVRGQTRWNTCSPAPRKAHRSDHPNPVQGTHPAPGPQRPAGWPRHVGRLAAWAAAALLLASPAAQAGQACETQPLRALEIERGMALAQATAQALDASGAQVLLLARAGQDLGEYGLAWSHLGWAYKTQPPAPARPVWRVLHKLNACGTGQAALYRQGLGEFFMDRPHRYEAAFSVPSAEVQARLLPLLSDNARASQWHEPRYSLVAYPWAQRYQQSNQWAIETLAGAMDEAASSRPRAQAWLQLRGYQPSVLHIGAMKRLGARASAAHISFDDHPNEKRFSDRIETVTVDSVLDWLARSGLGSAPQRLAL